MSQMRMLNLSNTEDIQLHYIVDAKTSVMPGLLVRSCGLQSTRWITDNFRMLTQLDISNNLILDFSSLCQLEALQHLTCNNCKIVDLTSIPPLPHLMSLNAQFNQIRELDIKHFVQLQLLNLQHNMVRTLKHVQQHGLQIISLLDNPVCVVVNVELQLKSIFPRLSSINNRQCQLQQVPKEEYLKTFFDCSEVKQNHSVIRYKGQRGSVELVSTNGLCEEQSEVLFSTGFESLKVQFFLCSSAQTTEVFADDSYIKIPPGSEGSVLIAAIQTDDGIVLVKSQDIIHRTPKIQSFQIIGTPAVGQTLTATFAFNNNVMDFRTNVIWAREGIVLGQGIEYVVKLNDAGTTITTTVQLIYSNKVCDIQTAQTTISKADEQKLLVLLQEGFLVRRAHAFIFLPNMKQAIELLHGRSDLSVLWADNQTVVKNKSFSYISQTQGTGELKATVSLGKHRVSYSAPSVYLPQRTFDIQHCCELNTAKLVGARNARSIRWLISHWSVLDVVENCGVRPEAVISQISTQKIRTDSLGLYTVSFQRQKLVFSEYADAKDRATFFIPENSYGKILCALVDEDEAIYEVIEMQQQIQVEDIGVKNASSSLAVELRCVGDSGIFTFQFNVCIEVGNVKGPSRSFSTVSKTTKAAIPKNKIYQKVVEVLAAAGEEPDGSEMFRVVIYFQVIAKNVFTDLEIKQPVQTEFTLYPSFDEIKQGACLVLVEDEVEDPKMLNLIDISVLQKDAGGFSLLQYMNPQQMNLTSYLVYDKLLFTFPFVDRVPLREAVQCKHQNTFIQQLMSRNLIGNQNELKIQGDCEIGKKLIMEPSSSIAHFGVLSSDQVQTDDVQTRLQFEEQRRVILNLRTKLSKYDRLLNVRSLDVPEFTICQKDVGKELYFFCLNEANLLQLYKLRNPIFHTGYFKRCTISQLELKTGEIELQVDGEEKISEAHINILEPNGDRWRIYPRTMSFQNGVNRVVFFVYLVSNVYQAYIDLIIHQQCLRLMMPVQKEKEASLALIPMPEAVEQPEGQKPSQTTEKQQAAQDTYEEEREYHDRETFPMQQQDTTQWNKVQQRLYAQEVIPKTNYDRKAVSKYNSAAVERLVKSNASLVIQNDAVQIKNVLLSQQSIGATHSALDQGFNPGQINQFDVRRACQQLRQQPVDNLQFSFSFTTKKRLLSKDQVQLFRSSQRYFEPVIPSDDLLVFLKGRQHETSEYYLTYRISEYDIGFWLIMRVFLQETSNYNYFLLNKSPVLPSPETKQALLQPYQRQTEPTVDGLVGYDSVGQITYNTAKIQFGLRYLTLFNAQKTIFSMKRDACRFVQTEARSEVQLITPEHRVIFNTAQNSVQHLKRIFLLGNLVHHATSLKDASGKGADFTMESIFNQQYAAPGTQSAYLFSIKTNPTQRGTEQMFEQFKELKLQQQYGHVAEKTFTIWARDFQQQISHPQIIHKFFAGMTLSYGPYSFYRHQDKLQYIPAIQVPCYYGSKDCVLEIDGEMIRLIDKNIVPFKRLYNELRYKFSDKQITFFSDQAEFTIIFDQAVFNQVVEQIFVRTKWGDA